MWSALREKNFHGDTAGAAAIEFALVVPVFLLLMFGMLCYGIYFGAAQSVQQIAADVARISVGGLDHEDRVALADRYMEQNADSYPLVRREDLRVVFSSSGVGETQFEVAIEYDARHLPIWSLHPPFPLPSETIVRVSRVRVGGA